MPGVIQYMQAAHLHPTSTAAWTHFSQFSVAVSDKNNDETKNQKKSVSQKIDTVAY